MINHIVKLIYAIKIPILYEFNNYVYFKRTYKFIDPITFMINHIVQLIYAIKIPILYEFFLFRFVLLLLDLVFPK